MSAFTLVAEILSIMGMIFNITSFLQKTQRNILIFQFFGASFFTVSFFMLGAPTGACLNVAAIIRAIIYANKEKFRANKKIWVFLFFLVYVLIYIATFTVFHKDISVKNCLIEILPVVAMTVATISFSMPEAKHVRLLALISSPLWLIYNVFSVSLGGVLCEGFSIGAVFVGMFCHDRKKIK